MATVLIIEDDPSIALMVTEILELNGIDTLAFESGEKCLQQLPAESPLLIISDMILPEMNAIDLLSKVRAHYKKPEIEAIFMSARNKNEIHENELNAKNIEFFSKPFNIQTFVSKVLELLKKARQER